VRASATLINDGQKIPGRSRFEMRIEGDAGAIVASEIHSGVGITGPAPEASTPRLPHRPPRALWRGMAGPLPLPAGHDGAVDCKGGILYEVKQAAWLCGSLGSMRGKELFLNGEHLFLEGCIHASGPAAEGMGNLKKATRRRDFRICCARWA